MFYRDFTRTEIHDMLNASGFSFDGNFKFPTAGGNQAYAFVADGAILIDKSLGLTEQLESVIKRELKIVKRKTWKTKKEESDPSKRVYEAAVPKTITKLKSINVLENYSRELDTIRPGKSDASKYHDLIFNILKTVFDGRLRRPEKEEYLAGDTQRVDITFQNRRENGFFKQLDEGYHITCPNIFVECKNYNGDLGGPEFAQIQSRLNETRGQFGIIVCRNILDLRKAKERQDNLKKDKKYVIVLTDQDIKKLAKLKMSGKEDEIDNLLEDKFKKLT